MQKMQLQSRPLAATIRQMRSGRCSRMAKENGHLPEATMPMECWRRRFSRWGLEDAAGWQEETVTFRRQQALAAALAPPLGADKSSLATGSATLSLAAGSASGDARLCTGVNMGYSLIGPPLGKGSFGTTYHAVWKNGDTDAGGQHIVVKHLPLDRPEKSL